MKQHTTISKGDIFSSNIHTAAGKKHDHYIVFLRFYPENDQFYIGALLTHSKINGNIPLLKYHFIEKDKNGNIYKVKFDKSLVANHPVYKKNDLDMSNLVGRLSEEGVAFVEKNIAAYERQFINRGIH